jgi:hypothetical protein
MRSFKHTFQRYSRRFDIDFYATKEEADVSEADLIVPGAHEEQLPSRSWANRAPMDMYSRV